MNELSAETHLTGRQAAGTRKKKGKLAFFVFIVIWISLIGGGVYGAKLYMERMQQTITADIERQTAAHIEAMQESYNASLLEVETNYQAEMAELKGKIDALNEMLAFARDTADSKTDNSNQLYAQLNEVKKQLNELKKSLDVLK